jgi:hypothetical protein
MPVYGPANVTHPNPSQQPLYKKLASTLPNRTEFE